MQIVKVKHNIQALIVHRRGSRARAQSQERYYQDDSGSLEYFPTDKETKTAHTASIDTDKGKSQKKAQRWSRQVGRAVFAGSPDKLIGFKTFIQDERI